MHFSTLAIAIAACNGFVAAVPKPNLLSRGTETIPAVEGAGQSGHDADDAIAYAWTVKDKERDVAADPVARAVDAVVRAIKERATVPAVESAGQSGHDADDAIAYAWTVKDKERDVAADPVARAVEAVVRTIKRDCGIVHDGDDVHDTE